MAKSEPATFEPYLNYIRCDQDYTTKIAAGWCAACGGIGPYQFVEVITDKLSTEWRLNRAERQAMSARESMYCAYCGCSQRLRNLALALVLQRGNTKATLSSLREAIASSDFHKLKVAEINSCGTLHAILSGIHRLVYSEYGSEDPAIPHQDLMELSYADQSFDIVLSSDTLEHVPDPKVALQETFRILKKGGVTICTVPAFLNKPGRQRVSLKDGTPVALTDKSYHGSGEPDYLVWNEFGANFIDILNAVGFEVQVYFMNLAHLDDPSYVFVAKRPWGTIAAPNKAIMVDPSLPPTADPAKFLKTRRLSQSPAATAPQLSAVMQERLQELIKKQQLTIDHARNLAVITDDQTQYIDKLTADIRTLETELRDQQQQLQKLQRSRLLRLSKKLRRK